MTITFMKYYSTKFSRIIIDHLKALKCTVRIPSIEISLYIERITGGIHIHHRS